VKRSGPASLFLQTLALVIATVITAQLALIVAIFSLPPPTPEIYTVSDVVAALRSAQRTQGREGAHLIKSLRANAPSPPAMGRGRLQFRSEVAQALGVPADDVVLERASRRFVDPQREHAAALAMGVRPDAPFLIGHFTLAVRQNDGRWLTLTPERRFGVDPWQERFLLVSALAALAVTPLAWWFSRRISAPMATLAEGAERLGRAPSAPPLEITGPSEVVAAVEAFNQMQARLRLYVDDRTTMIGAIAHDLKTPLTRMRFRIEGAPADLKTKLSRDIDQMDAMVEGTLAFVHEASSPHQRVKLEIASLVETIMDEAAETGAAAAAEPSERVIVDGDPVALRRLIGNLVDNALKFGARARARVFALNGLAVIEIDDDGPGIPADLVERAFEPFRRLETSRNRATGGAGLGLAVVRTIARAHGGDVQLRSRPDGGLRARVTLPLALPAR
jgi:signal transduction histidine kinase